MKPPIFQRRRWLPAFALIVTLYTGALGQTQPATSGPTAPEAPKAAETRPEPSSPRQIRTETPLAVTDGVPGDARVIHDLSPWSMFLAADVVVKSVIIGLLSASLVTWTILVGKTAELSIARRRLKKALAGIEGATGLTDAEQAIGSRDSLLARLVAVAVQERNLSAPTASATAVKERADSHFADLVRAETQAMRRGMGLLATIGSTGPFVGLFGTVWGIMNSFIGISKSQTTNLAVVAPGIAEALLATAIGLVAAIPAVIIYNHFSRATRSYQLLVSRASGMVGRLLSRDFDREHAARPRAVE